jgi:hypothetical protein
MKPKGPTKAAASLFQFSLGTLLLVLVSVALVGGMLTEEVRLTNRHMQQVNNYIFAWMDRRTTMTRDDVRSFFDVPPTPESAGTEIEVFQWRGWLFTHQYMIGFNAEGRPTTTIGADRPRLGIGALVLAALAIFWTWRWCRWAIRRRQSTAKRERAVPGNADSSP